MEIEGATGGRRGLGSANHCMHGSDSVIEEILDRRPSLVDQLGIEHANRIANSGPEPAIDLGSAAVVPLDGQGVVISSSHPFIDGGDYDGDGKIDRFKA